MSDAPGIRKRIGLELFRKLHKNIVAEHQLRTLFWECTLRCNLQCLHCGSDCRATSGLGDMPVSDFLRVIDSITPQVNPNKVFVIFSGGEALMRKDLEVCGRALYDRGYPWGVVTNAMLLTGARFDSLLGAGMHAMTVSLDGFEPEHNWLRGSPKSFSRVMDALELMTAEKELLWDVVTCANKRNIGYLEQFKEFLIGKGVPRWRIFTIFPVGRGATSDGMQISDAEFVGLMDFIKRTRKEGRIKVDYGCEGFLGNYESEVRDSFYHCNAGVSTASVLHDGSISGCTSIRANFHQGNIYRDSFMDVWNSRFEKFRNKEWARTGICADCSMFRYCEGNGMHLRGDNEELLLCHYKRICDGRGR